MIEQPVAIMVTFGQGMIKTHGGLQKFARYFLQSMADPECVWLHKATNLPTQSVAWVYIVIGNRVRYRANCVGYSRNPTTIWKADGTSRLITWPRVEMTGPLIMAPGKIHRQGFQGFRYLPEQIF